MDYLERFGIDKYINAHDTVTLYGGSRIGQAAKDAALQVSSVFVDFDQMQYVLGCQIAKLTGNEAAFICGGASSGVQLAAAVFMAEGSEYLYSRLPYAEKNEFIVFHSNMNCYTKAIEAAGGVIRRIGDVDEVRESELEGVISDKTAGVFLFPNRAYDRASIPLRRTAEIAHEHGIPVAVDAAAYLPPVENLWKFTEEGADLVIFSGGKSLCGSQSSGLIVGKERYIADCRRFGEPAHGICRSAKVSKEAMIALRVAIEEFVGKSSEEHWASIERKIDRLSVIIGEAVPLHKIMHGSVGQSYPRLSIDLSSEDEAEHLKAYMKKNHVFIGVSGSSAVISAQNLSDDETETVGNLILSYVKENGGN